MFSLSDLTLTMFICLNFEVIMKLFYGYNFTSWLLFGKYNISWHKNVAISLQVLVYNILY